MTLPDRGFSRNELPLGTRTSMEYYFRFLGFVEKKKGAQLALLFNFI